MSIKTVLFDLDGTLLPMDLDIFVKEYFKALAANLAGHGYDPKKLIDAVWVGTKDMIQNDGSKPNAQAFWDRFASIFGPQALEDMPLFDEFYRTHFDETRKVCGFDPAAAEAVYRIKEMGLPVVLATNPIFHRRRWKSASPGPVCSRRISNCTPLMKTAATPSPIPSITPTFWRS